MTTITRHGGWAYPPADGLMWRHQDADGGYQTSHLKAALAHVTDFSLACDGGAHVGMWTKPLSEVFARVIAVEPSPDTFEALQVNLATFGCGNVEARNIALGAKAGWVSMVLDAENTARANTGGRFVQADGPIPMFAIDALGLPSLGFLKLDVEGSEYAALLGAQKTLKRCRPIVLFENKGLWQKYGVPREGPQTFLTSLGYRELERVGCDVIWGPT